jgi:hypothetical protein
MDEETETEVHPNEVIGAFVYNWEHSVRRAIEQRNYPMAQMLAMNAVMRLGSLDELPLSVQVKMKRGAYGPTRMAVTYLRGIATEPDTKRAVDAVLLPLRKQIAEIELILSGDEHYERFRRRNED